MLRHSRQSLSLSLPVASRRRFATIEPSYCHRSRYTCHLQRTSPPVLCYQCLFRWAGNSCLIVRIDATPFHKHVLINVGAIGREMVGIKLWSVSSSRHAYLLFLVDIDQYPRRTASCLVTELPPMHRQALALGHATLRNPIYALNLRRHQPLTRSRIKASDKISTSQVPLPTPVHDTFFGLCVLVPPSRRRSLQACHVVNPVKLHILFVPMVLLVDAPGTSKTAIVARTKGGVPDLPQWWARRTKMNTEFLAEGYQRVTGASAFLSVS